MSILHFDCFRGAAGDMIVGALVDLGADGKGVIRGIDRLGLPGLQVSFRSVLRGGLAATQFVVEAPGPHPHRGLGEIRRLLGSSGLPAGVREAALKVFERLCGVEARLHGVDIDEVHLHEVGAADAIADVVGAALALHELGPEEITVAPLPLGSGQVEAEHGTLPVPAPATLELLRGCPVRGGPVEGELVTPTGAAILTTVANRFGPLPEMRVEGSGFGAGSHDPPRVANVLRVVQGERLATGAEAGEVVVMEANIDDMSPEGLGHVMERLLTAGARDVFFTSVQMKKNRPGVLVTCLADEARSIDLGRLLFRETTTLGVRYHRARRWELPREMKSVSTPYGPVTVKIARLDDSVVRISPEYEDCRRAALEHGVTLEQVRAAALRAAEETGA